MNGVMKASITSALLLGVVCASSVALGADQPIEEVHTHGERPTEEVSGQSMTGQDIKKVQMQYHVRYDDLDLTSKNGVKALRKRVTQAALKGCADLGRRYGNLRPDSTCAAAARRTANSQVERAIAEAKSMAALKDAKLQDDQAIAQKDPDK